MEFLIPDDEADDVEFEKRVKILVGRVVRALLIVPCDYMVITVVFGAIHWTGWSFHFPSSIERTLWRFASFSRTGVPIMILPIRFTWSWQLQLSGF